MRYFIKVILLTIIFVSFILNKNYSSYKNYCNNINEQIDWTINKYQRLSIYLKYKYQTNYDINRYAGLLQFEYEILNKNNEMFSIHLSKKIQESYLDNNKVNKKSKATGENQIRKICAKHYNFTYEQVKDSMEINSLVAIKMFYDMLLKCNNDTNKALISYCFGFTGAKRINFNSQYGNNIIEKSKGIKYQLNLIGF